MRQYEGREPHTRDHVEAQRQEQYPRLLRIAITTVAEVTQKAGGCRELPRPVPARHDVVDAGAVYQKQAPLSDYNSNCHDINLSLSASLGGVGASMSETVRQCEYWDVVGGNEHHASKRYDIHYDNKGSCSAESREASELAVYAVPQGKARGLVAWYGVNPGNAPYVSGCSGRTADCSGS